jgi:iron-sulfur cluster assembly accessory protein
MITLTDKAADKVRTLQQQESKQGFALRLRVVGGGCSGYSYSMDLEQAGSEGDRIFEDHGVKIIVDPKSLPMLDHCQVDWVDAMTGAGFTIQNPNAKGSCGCGHSFTV